MNHGDTYRWALAASEAVHWRVEDIIGGDLRFDFARQQVEFDMEAFERATGRMLAAAERDEFRRVQIAANRWTYLGSGMTRERVPETLESMSPAARARVGSAAPAFC